jgi:hypothetical protein
LCCFQVSPAIVFEIIDLFGSRVVTDSQTAVRIAPSERFITATTVTAAAGVATFDSLSLRASAVNVTQCSFTAQLAGSGGATFSSRATCLAVKLIQCCGAVSVQPIGNFTLFSRPCVAGQRAQGEFCKDCSAGTFSVVASEL